MEELQTESHQVRSALFATKHRLLAELAASHVQFIFRFVFLWGAAAACAAATFSYNAASSTVFTPLTISTKKYFIKTFTKSLLY